MTDILFTPTLQDAFVRAALEYPYDAGTGTITRFSTNGNKHDTAGWLSLFPDGLGAVFGCWRDGTSYIWQQRIDGAPKPTSEELKQAKAKAAQARKQAEQERDKIHAEVAKLQAVVHGGLPAATSENAYLKRKGVSPHGDMRQGGDGQLIIPVYDANGVIQSLQHIFPDGRKQFAKDARMKGGRFVFGELADGEPITLVEGYATGASIYEACACAVACCFFGANLATVSADLRKRYPKSLIRIAADLDAHGKGADYARAAVAQAMPKSEMVLPVFSDGRNSGDFNDQHQFAGLDEVRRQVDRVGSATIDLVQAGDGKVPARAFDAPALAVADSRDGTATTRPLTEYGNALRLLDQHDDQLRYVQNVKSWIIWRDGAWQWDTTSAGVRALAASLSVKIYAEGADCDMVQAVHFAKWARQSQNSRTIDAAVSLLSVQEKIRLSIAAIDADPMLVGFDNARQVIDLRTGKARPATQADYITKSLTPCTIGESAKALRWHSFLEQIFDNDAELIDWLHRWCGYLLTGMTTEQVFLFGFGLGANGKTVLAELLKYILGDYARSIASETLTETKRQAGGASPDLADLIGCRMAMSAETEDGAALAESLVKSLTSGDTITARQLYTSPVQFIPAFKLLMIGNHRPVIRGNDYGIWRRVRLVPFTRTFTEQERDPHLLDKLKAEAPHILAWAVQGCLEWQRLGLADVPAVVASQTAEYRQEQDVIGQWLSECTKADRAAEADTGEAYSSYRNWALDNGLKPASNVSLGRRLSERGFFARKSSSRRFWVGMALNASNGAGFSYGE